jgi:hypothetical protein
VTTGRDAGPKLNMEVPSMANYSALLSIVFMMSYVVLFDAVHWRKRFTRLFCSSNLLSQDELDRLATIWSACQDA